MALEEWTDARSRFQGYLTSGGRKAVEEAGDKRLKALLEKKIKVCEAFGLGVVAPDIEGIDLDGVAFKLSDYKGKVLFVDFWGDW